MSIRTMHNEGNSTKRITDSRETTVDTSSMHHTNTTDTTDKADATNATNKTSVGRAYGDQDVLVGGFGPLGHGTSRGIDLVSLTRDDRDGSPDGAGMLVHRGLAAALPSPSWMIREPREGRDDGHDVIYAVLEHTQEVASLRLERARNGRDGRVWPTLTLLSRVSVPGHSPTHLALVRDAEGARHLIVACYEDGMVCVLPVDRDGLLGEVEQSIPGEGSGPLPAQEGSHAHWVLPLPDGRVLTSDLGADRVRVHCWEHHTLRRVGEVVCTPGTGPRDIHLMPLPAGSRVPWTAAVVGEWGCTVTMLAPKEDDSQRIIVSQGVDLGSDGHDQAASLAFVSDDPRRSADGVNVSSNGFVYVGLRGSNRIVPLRWENGRLSRLEAPGAGASHDGGNSWRAGVPSGGAWPRHIAALGRRLLVANQNSGTVDLFGVAADGELVHRSRLSVGSPTVVMPLP